MAAFGDHAAAATGLRELPGIEVIFCNRAGAYAAGGYSDAGHSSMDLWRDRIIEC